MVQISRPYMITGKNIVLNIWTLLAKCMAPLFNMLSRFVIPFLPRSKHLLILWLQSLSTVTLEPEEINLSLFPLSLHLFAMKWWARCNDLDFFECWVLSQLLPFSSITLIKQLLNSSSTSAPRVVIICVSDVVDISPGHHDFSFESSSPTFHMMYSACKFNKQGDSK